MQVVPMRSIGWAVVALVGWGVWGLLTGLAARHGTALGAVAGALIVEALLFAPFWGQIRMSFSWSMVGAGVAGGLAYGALYLALQAGGATSVLIALTAMYPAVTLILARLLMGEELTVRRIVGIGLAVVAGVLLA